MSNSFQIWDHFLPFFPPKDSKNLKSLDIGLWEFGGGGTVKRSEKHRYQKILLSKAKLAQKQTFLLGNFTPFDSKRFKIWDLFFLLLFPKDSKNLKSLDIGLWEVGAKRPLNGVRNCDEQTNKQTDKHTDISTYRKNRPRGPMLWKCLTQKNA